MKKPQRVTRADLLKQDRIAKGPRWQPYFPVVIEMVPDLEMTPEWREATSSRYFEEWKNNPACVRRVQGAVATQIILKLRNENVRQLIESGNQFWMELAIRVVSCQQRWHQSGRIQVSALRSLTRRLSVPGLPGEEQERLRKTICGSLLNKIDIGAGEEFRALVGIARRVATSDLIAGLEERAQESEKPSVGKVWISVVGQRRPNSSLGISHRCIEDMAVNLRG